MAMRSSSRRTKSGPLMVSNLTSERPGSISVKMTNADASVA